MHQNLPTEDATCRQVQAFTQGLQTVGQYIDTQADPISPAVRQAKLQGQRSLQGWQAQSQGIPARGAWPWRQDYTVLRLCVNNVVQTLTSSKKNVELSTRSVTTVGDWDTS